MRSALSPRSAPADDALEALAALQRARRRARAARIDWVDALYHAYLTGLTAVVGVLVLSALVGDAQVAASGLRRVTADGPAVVGLAVAVAVALGLRSGGRGGPLALEAAEVHHVVLSPVERDRVLRRPALRLVRFTAFAGAVAGAVAGQLALRRLPGTPLSWVVWPALAGALAALAAAGAALACGGRRLRPTVATALAIVVVGWSGLDLSLGVTTSPLTLLGRLALWPLGFDALGLVGAVACLGLAGAGLSLVRGLSVEAAVRRAALVSQLRFAATVQDVRTVVLLRRQLAHERSRPRPWLATGRKQGARLPVWRRDWRGTMRWPASRLVRAVILGAVAGVALRGAWAGTTPLMVVAGLALYVAALDSVEPMAQEVDHPDRPASYPLAAGVLHLRHLAAPLVIMLVVGVVGLASAFALGSGRVVLEVGLATLLPAAATAVSGAAASTLLGSVTGKGGGFLAMPEAMGTAVLFRTGWPAAVAVAGTLPVLAGRQAASRGFAPGPPAVAAGVGVLMVVALALAWVRYREEARAWWEETLSQAGMGGGKSPS